MSILLTFIGWFLLLTCGPALWSHSVNRWMWREKQKRKAERLNPTPMTAEEIKHSDEDQLIAPAILLAAVAFWLIAHFLGWTG